MSTSHAYLDFFAHGWVEVINRFFRLICSQASCHDFSLFFSIFPPPPGRILNRNSRNVRNAYSEKSAVETRRRLLHERLWHALCVALACVCRLALFFFFKSLMVYRISSIIYHLSSIINLSFYRVERIEYRIPSIEAQVSKRKYQSASIETQVLDRKYETVITFRKHVYSICYLWYIVHSIAVCGYSGMRI